MIIGEVYRNDSDEGELELLSAINTLLLADENIRGNNFIFTYGGQTAQFHNGKIGGSCDMEEMGAENVSESEFKKQTGLALLSKNLNTIDNIIFNSTWAFMMGPAAILNQNMDTLPENDNTSKGKMKQLILSTEEPYFNKPENGYDKKNGGFRFDNLNSFKEYINHPGFDVSWYTFKDNGWKGRFADRFMTYLKQILNN